MRDMIIASLLAALTVLVFTYLVVNCYDLGLITLCTIR